MSPEKQETLYNKYPYLFDRHKLSPQETCMYWGICVGDGWYDIVDRLCQRIVEFCSTNNRQVPQFEQVKEKFGGLRIYLDSGGCDEIYEFIRDAENESFKTCEETGDEGSPYSCNGWLKVLSDKIAAEKGYIKIDN